MDQETMGAARRTIALRATQAIPAIPAIRAIRITRTLHPMVTTVPTTQFQTTLITAVHLSIMEMSRA